jgi:hypothetical protein
MEAAWRAGMNAYRQLPLTTQEFRTIDSNVPPYMIPGAAH